MSFKSVFFGLAVLLSASSVSMAQSMPNYGPNPPQNTDSFGQVPSGAKPAMPIPVSLVLNRAVAPAPLAWTCQDWIAMEMAKSTIAAAKTKPTAITIRRHINTEQPPCLLWDRQSHIRALIWVNDC